jgi:hypothetical protein
MYSARPSNNLTNDILDFINRYSHREYICIFYRSFLITKDENVYFIKFFWLPRLNFGIAVGTTHLDQPIPAGTLFCKILSRNDKQKILFRFSYNSDLSYQNISDCKNLCIDLDTVSFPLRRATYWHQIWYGNHSECIHPIDIFWHVAGDVILQIFRSYNRILIRDAINNSWHRSPNDIITGLCIVRIDGMSPDWFSTHKVSYPEHRIKNYGPVRDLSFY